MDPILQKNMGLYLESMKKKSKKWSSISGLEVCIGRSAGEPVIHFQRRFPFSKVNIMLTLCSLNNINGCNKCRKCLKCHVNIYSQKLALNLLISTSEQMNLFHTLHILANIHIYHILTNIQTIHCFKKLWNSMSSGLENISALIHQCREGCPCV